MAAARFLTAARAASLSRDCEGVLRMPSDDWEPPCCCCCCCWEPPRPRLDSRLDAVDLAENRRVKRNELERKVPCILVASERQGTDADVGGANESMLLATL